MLGQTGSDFQTLVRLHRKSRHRSELLHERDDDDAAQYDEQRDDGIREHGVQEQQEQYYRDFYEAYFGEKE